VRGCVIAVDHFHVFLPQSNGFCLLRCLCLENTCLALLQAPPGLRCCRMTRRVSLTHLLSRWGSLPGGLSPPMASPEYLELSQSPSRQEAAGRALPVAQADMMGGEGRWVVLVLYMEQPAVTLMATWHWGWP